MNATNDWQQLAQTWQAQAVYLPTLRRSTRWHTLRLYVYAGIEVGIVLMIWALTIYWQWIEPLPLLWQLWAWLWSLLAPIMTALNMRARRGTWRAQEDSVRGLLDLKRRRALAALQLIRFGERFGPAGILLGWLWNGLWAWSRPSAAPWWQLFSGALVVTVIIGSSLWLSRRRARRERRTLAETESLLQDLA